MTEPIARLDITEHDGIRRFLYLMRAGINRELRRRMGDGLHTLVDEAGNTVPTRVIIDGPARGIWFAHSLPPFAHQALSLVPTDAPMDVPDKMTVSVDESGNLSTSQEHVAFHASASGELNSCVYDGFEHLVSPAHWLINGKAEADGVGTWTDIGGLGAFGDASFADAVESVTLQTWLTAFTSCVQQTLEITGTADCTACWVLPLNLPASDLIVDLGLGNGAYLRSASADQAILIELDSEKRAWCAWRAGYADAATVRDAAMSGDSCEQSFTRIDYAGVAKTDDVAGRLWLHVIGGRKSAALAIFIAGLHWRRIVIAVEPGGHTTLRVTMAPSHFHKFSAAVHFLNDIPPVASATNPASILCEPEYAWEK